MLGDDKGTIWTVGEGGRAFVKTAANPQWKDISVENWMDGGGLNALALFARTGNYMALAVGDHGAYSELEVNKSSPYTIIRFTSDNLTGLWSPGAFPMWATTDTGKVFRVPQNYLSTAEVPGGTGDLGVASLYGVWDTDNGSMARAVGSSETIRSCTNSCTNVRRNDMGGRVFRSIWGNDNENYWIAAEAGLLRHWDGKNGITDIIMATQDFYSVHGVGNTVWAVGGRNTVLRLVNAATKTWEVVPGPMEGRDLRGVWVSSMSDEFWVVGTGGLIAHRPSKPVVK